MRFKRHWEKFLDTNTADVFFGASIVAFVWAIAYSIIWMFF